MNGEVGSLAGRSAGTDPHAEDPRLRGRTYAIPFERVWASAEGVAREAPRWRLVSSDDRQGVIVAEAQTFLTRRAADARVEVRLDENGQTRLDVRVIMRGDRVDLGASRRLVASFIKRVEAALEPSPDQILDASRAPSWSS